MKLVAIIYIIGAFAIFQTYNGNALQLQNNGNLTLKDGSTTLNIP